MMGNACPLCHNTSSPFHQSNLSYHQCDECHAVFMDKSCHLNGEQEKNRYLEHNNDVTDAGYQQFVSPVTNAVLEYHSSQQQGLDFGAGTGPVIAKMLNDKGFSIELYDPFFHNDASLLEQQYDYIVCCEVMEHFYQPDKEFALLRRLLKPNGRLYCMTDRYYDDIDFAKWYYKNDNTHVFFYHQNSLEFIKKQHDFSTLEMGERLIVFTV